MVIIVGVRFPASSKIYYFSPGSFEICMGDGVIVETVHGQEYGVICEGPTEVAMNSLVVPLKEVLRMATQEDMDMREQGEEKVQEAKRIASEKIEEHGLDMKLVDVDFSFDGNKITFFFTSDGRVDFRALVKDLAGIFRTRIELRQIGVRDEARMVGGLGCCGREVCCRKFLKDFHPVSIKMAKEQSLSLNPTKISGICGRLMCCLQYEQSTYEALRKEMPRIGTILYTPEGQGVVIATQVIAEKLRVRVQQPDNSYAIFDFRTDEVSLDHPVPRKAPEPLPELEIAQEWENLGPLSEELGGPSERERNQAARSGQRNNRGSQGGRGRNDRGGRGNGPRKEGAEKGSSPAQKQGVARREGGDGAREDGPRRHRRGGRGRGGNEGANGNNNASGNANGSASGSGQRSNASQSQAGPKPKSEGKEGGANGNNNASSNTNNGSNGNGNGSGNPSRNRNRSRNRRPGGGASGGNKPNPGNAPKGES